MTKKKILILGSRGMLGQELCLVFSRDGQYEVIGWDKEDLDVTDFPGAKQKIFQVKPAIILNAVAYNAVDACEENENEYGKALLLNAELPEFLAQLAKELDAWLIHYSTDYVFGGNERQEYGFDERVEPMPVCRYAMSKREGEKRVEAVGGKYSLVRLSKLFGKPALSEAGKKSFFEIMLTLGKTKEEISAVDEEVSCFTYAPDLAQASKDLVEAGNEYGIYHLPNESPATWYEGVRELYRQAGISTRVLPVSSDAFPRPAKRPAFSVLRNTKRPKLRSYQEALREFLREYLEKK